MHSFYTMNVNKANSNLYAWHRMDDEQYMIEVKTFA